MQCEIFLDAFMLRSLYNWTINLAAKPYAVFALFAVAFAEASFFLIPPEALMIPMILADRKRAWFYAGMTTMASVSGGFLGYAIGYFAFDTIGQPILNFYHVADKFEALKLMYAKWGGWLIMIKGLTPIPYKLVTIASGAFHFDLATFGISSLISRGVRFFIVAALLWKFGEPIREFIERRLGLVFLVALAALIGGFLVLAYVI